MRTERFIKIKFILFDIFQQIIRRDGLAYVIVPGYAKSDSYYVLIETGEKVPPEKILGYIDPLTGERRVEGQIHPADTEEVVDVEPINPTDKKELEKILSEITQGPINFW